MLTTANSVDRLQRLPSVGQPVELCGLIGRVYPLDVAQSGQAFCRVVLMDECCGPAGVHKNLDGVVRTVLYILT